MLVTPTSGGPTYAEKGNSKTGCNSTGQRMYDAANTSSSTGGSGMSIVNCGKGKGVRMSWDSSGVKVQIMEYNVDGGSPMPYTGNWSGGKSDPKDPGTIGGADKENDNGKLMPVLRHGGRGYQGGGGNGTEDPSPWDDGNWYGGIFSGGGVHTDSGGGLPIDPLPHDRV
jgi:hypothetical protein